MWIVYLLIAILVVALVLILAILPRKRRNRAPFDGTLYAHRGLHNNDGGIPENSLAAFAAAAKVHQAWCDGEMDAFYGRMVAAHEKIANPGEAVRAAGMKNGAVRNVVEIKTTAN